MNIDFCRVNETHISLFFDFLITALAVRISVRLVEVKVEHSNICSTPVKSQGSLYYPAEQRHAVHAFHCNMVIGENP